MDTKRQDVGASVAPLRRPWLRGPELCRVAGITYRQMDYWARTGVLEPAIAARGSGSQRRYSAHQAHVAHVLGLLAEMGARRTALTSTALALEMLPAAEWKGLLFVWPDGETHLSSADMRSRPVFRAAWVVDLEACLVAVAGVQDQGPPSTAAVV